MTIQTQQRDIFDTQSAAAYLCLSKPTLERYRLRGDGPVFAKIGKSVRYRKVDLDAWIATRLVKSTSQVAA